MQRSFHSLYRLRKLDTLNQTTELDIRDYSLTYRPSRHLTIYAYQQSTIVILPCMELHMGCTDAEQNVDSLMLICCGLLSIVKTVCFRIYADNLIDTYNAAIDDYLTIENPEQRKIMRRYAFIGRTLACSMVCFAYFACVVYTLIPLLGDEPINQFNVTNEEAVLEYTIPSRCALEYLHAPTSMYEFITLTESFMMTLTCTCNHGNTYLVTNICIENRHLWSIILFRRCRIVLYT